jgi:hypothetical protein
MLRFCFVLTMATLAAAGPGYKSMMMKKMAKHYFDQMCWGKDNQMEKYKSIKESLAACMGEAAPAPRAMPQGAMPLNLVMKPVHSYQLPASTYSIVPPYQFARYHTLGKRATAEEETAEFLNDWVDFKGDLKHKIGNLTCVFDKMGLHTASGDVNLSFFTTDFWNNINLESTLAGSDPNWRSMLTTRWTDCYNKAQAIPTEALTRMSFMKSMPQLARNMEFWMCAMEAKTDCCSAALQHSMLEDMYGKDDGSIDWTQYGLPADKYELANVATMVLINSKSDMEKFICSFFESDGTDM